MEEVRLPKLVSVLLRPVFAVMLALAQFFSRRGTLLTQNVVVVGVGVVMALAGLWLWLSSARHLRSAQASQTIAATGPYRLIRHPVYASIYLISIGMGLIFFSWLWFVVLLVFAPLWWLEARDEEGTMLATHGVAYVNYQDRTAMWIPGVW